METYSKSQILKQLNENYIWRNVCDQNCFEIIDYALSSCKLKLKVAAPDMIYFASSKFSGSLVYKIKICMIWQVLFKLEYLFCQER